MFLETLIDRFHETLVCIKLFWFFFNMQSNIIHFYFVLQILKRKISLILHAALNEAKYYLTTN